MSRRTQTPTRGQDVIETSRLILRPVVEADAAMVAALAGDWDVARMLADMPHPLGVDAAEAWTKPGDGERGYAVVLDGQMIGGVSVFDLDLDPGHAAPQPAGVRMPDVQASTGSLSELGFWLGRKWWGHGFAREAASAVVASDFSRRAVQAFVSGHFVDNPASQRILLALDFVETRRGPQWCLARNQSVIAVRYILHAPHRDEPTDRNER